MIHQLNRYLLYDKYRMGKDVIERFESKSMERWEELSDDKPFEFELFLGQPIRSPRPGQPRYDLDIESVNLYFHIYTRREWRRVPLVKRANHLWDIPTDHLPSFRHYSRARDRRWFISMRFSSRNPRLVKWYDFSTPWTFEVEIRQVPDELTPSKRRYAIVRHAQWREFPDFRRRRRFPALS